jgi:hypothetical protein
LREKKAYVLDSVRKQRFVGFMHKRQRKTTFVGLLYPCNTVLTISTLKILLMKRCTRKSHYTDVMDWNNNYPL